MPHVIIKHFPAELSETKQAKLRDAVLEAIQTAFSCNLASISIALRPIEPDRWNAEVYVPDVQVTSDNLIKVPDYTA